MSDILASDENITLLVYDGNTILEEEEATGMVDDVVFVFTNNWGWVGGCC
jgi:hypothetical protein